MHHTDRDGLRFQEHSNPGFTCRSQATAVVHGEKNELNFVMQENKASMNLLGLRFRDQNATSRQGPVRR